MADTLTDADIDKLEAQTGFSNSPVLTDADIDKLDQFHTSLLSDAGKFAVGTGKQILQKAVSVPGQLYNLGKDVLTKAPGELVDVATEEKPILGATQQFSQNLGQTLLPVTVPEGARTYTEKAIGKAATLLPNALGGISEEDYQNLYGNRSIEDLTQQNLQRSAQLQKQFPGIGAAGTVTAGIGLGAGLGAAGVGKAATTGLIGTTSAGQAGTAALEQGKSVPEATQEAISSGLVNAGTATALQNIPKAAPVIEDLRNRLAIRALGPTAKDIRQLAPMRQQIGEQLFPEGNVLSPQMGPLTSKAGIAENLKTAKTTAGQQVQSNLTSIDEATNKIVNKQPTGNSLRDIDESAADTLEKAQSTVPLKDVANKADVPNIEPTAMQTTDIDSNPSGLDQTIPEGTVPINEGTAYQKASAANPAVTAVPMEKVVDPQIEQQITTKLQQQPVTVQAQIKQILDPARIIESVKAKLKTNEKLNDVYNAGDPADLGPTLDMQASKFGNIEQPTLKNLMSYRMGLDKIIDYERDPITGQANPKGQALKIFRDELQNHLMDAAERVDKLTGTNTFDALKTSMAKYHVLSKINKIAQRTVSQQESSASKYAPAGLGGTIGMGAKFLAGIGNITSMGLGVITGGVSMAAKAFGNQFAANSLNLLNKAIKATPQSFGQYAAPLQEAASRGTPALAAMHFALYNSDPDYRNIIDPMQEEAEKQNLGQ